MVKTESFEQVHIAQIADLHQWLEYHHAQKESVWLVLYKIVVPEKYIPKIEIIDELLCFGWIDGIARKVDQEKYLLLVSPRRVDHWAESYKKRLAALEQSGRMAESGLVAIRFARDTGLWDLMNDVDDLIIPTDFMEVLDQYPSALFNFENFAASHRRFTLRWIRIAKKTDTRKKRIALAAQLAAENKKIPGI